MNKRLLISCAVGMSLLITWGGIALGKAESKKSDTTKTEEDVVEEIFIVESEQEMITVEHIKSDEDEPIEYELSEEEEELGLKFTE